MMMQGRELTDSQITLNVLSHAGKTILFGSRPLRDYHGQQHPDSPDAGQILLWKDVTALHDTYRHNFWVSIVSAVIAFVFVEILIFFALKLASKRLEAIIEQRTDDVASRAKALDATPNFIAITDIEGNIEYVNAKATEITGYDEHELLGQNMAILSSGRTDNLTYQRLWKTILAGDEWRGEILNKRKDGQLYWAQNIISVQTNRDGHTTKFIVSQHDITEERKEREVILSHANTDPLTHLVNRRGFENHIHRLFESSKARNQSFVLLFLDLDHFKQINDQCGHQAGDKVLVDISQLIRQNLREHDVIARLGGDEFAVILEDCPLDNAYQIAEKICSAVNGYEFNCSNRTYKLGVSVGLTTSKEHDAHWNQTLHRADSACYAAKTAGRGQVRSQT
jgi:diguanylate cyclase (GGDEF)-like protein/PAS domain S-box-containing protein